MNTLSFEPLISPALWVLLAVLGVGMLAWYALRRPAAIVRRRWITALSLQALAMLGVLVILLNPTWVVPVRSDSGKPVFTIILDSTGSMSTPDVGSETRYNAAVRIAQDCEDRLRGRFDVRLVTSANGTKRVDAATLKSTVPEGASTDLAAALLAGVEQDRTQGQAVMLLSDGIHNASGANKVLEAARVAKAMACPVFPLTLGGNTSIKDLAIDLRAAQEIAFVKQTLDVPVVIRHRGLKGGQAVVRFATDGKELDRKTVPLADEETEVHFTATQEKTGMYRYDVSVEPLAEEVTRSNNAASLVLRVVDKPVRILVLEGRPYWDAKFLIRTLQADASIEVDSIVRVGDNRLIHRSLTRGTAEGTQEQSKVLPDLSTVMALSNDFRAYQVVVLGRDADTLLDDDVLNRIQTWLSRDGGSLVCYRGSPTSQVSQRLARLLPVRWSPASESRLAFKVTDRGRELGWFPRTTSKTDALQQLPTLAMSAKPEPPKPLAVVLATGATDDPAVSYQPFGSGRVVVVEGAGMWRWAFLPPQQQQLDLVYRSLWQGLVRWLVSSADLLPGQKYALRGEKSRFQPGESTAAALLRGEAAGDEPVPTIELRGDGLSEPRTVVPIPSGDDPRAFRVVFGPLPEGRYEARITGATSNDTGIATAFEVRNLTDEMLDLTARPDLMARIAEESGGSVLPAADTASLSDFISKEWERTRSHQVKRIAAWDRWWVLASVIGLWTAAWMLRRSGGLV